MNKSRSRSVAFALLCLGGGTVAWGDDLRLPVGHSPSGDVTGFRTVVAAGGDLVLYLWEESGAPHYAVSRDGGATLSGRVRRTSYEIKLRYAGFDPLVATPGVPGELVAAEGSALHLVQFETVSLEAYQSAVSGLGGEIVRFLPNHTHIVRMTADEAARVGALPFVRWVGRFHPAYKLAPGILSSIVAGSVGDGPGTYSIEVFRRGEEEQRLVGAFIEGLGGGVINTNADGFRMTVVLTADQLLEVARLDEVHYIDPWGPLEVDLDLVREIGGANFVESTFGYTGQGVRGEVLDTELDVNHPAWLLSPPPLIHSAGTSSPIIHGTSVYGICFAAGLNPARRGVLPDHEQGIFFRASDASQFGGGTSRHQIARELVDPAGPYRAVFQASSVGSPRNLFYSSISAEMDDVIFTTDLLHCQSQSNAGGTRNSRPQAWAKNMVSGGAVNHRDTLSRVDDRGLDPGGASIGPAEDGRIKPSLCFFYDDTLAPTAGGGYTQFGGTSGATPSIGGYAGLVFQMWHEGVWDGHVSGDSVFESRPSSSTVRALLINSAFRYDWTPGASPTTPDGITRFFQGWGMPDVRKAAERAEKTYVQDAVGTIAPLETQSFLFGVEAGESELLVSMVYMDPMGTTSASQHRINDLSLRVTSPSGVVYWGNNGLAAGNVSVAGGSSNEIDVEENVFLAFPEEGTWEVDVIADEIVQDAALQTPELDADYSLVVSGATFEVVDCDPDCTRDRVLDIFDFLCFQDAFVAGDPYADCTGDSVFNIFDFICYQDLFLIGCP